MKTTQILACLLTLSLAACTTASFGHRDRELNPDLRLAVLLDAYDQTRGGEEESSRLVVDVGRARNAIERLSLEFPGHVPTLMACAALAYDAREPEKSQAYLDRLFRAQVMHAEAGVLRSRIASEEGNLPLARRVLETQIQYTPDHAGLREALSGVLYMSKDWDGARRAIGAAEALGAPAWRVAYHRGLIAESADDTKEAQRQFQLATDGNPAFLPAKSRLSAMKATGG